jgi:hypothetical protein
MLSGVSAVVVAALLLGSPSRAESPPPTARGGAHADWRLYESQRGRFRIFFPGEPLVTHAAHRTVVGKVHTQRYQVRHLDAEFTVEINDLPGVAAFLLSDAAILDRAADGLLDDIEARELASSPVTRQGYPGRRVRYEILGGRHWVEEALLLLADTRLYIVMAGHRRETGEVPPTARFFESFEIRPAAPELAAD